MISGTGSPSADSGCRRSGARCGDRAARAPGCVGGAAASSTRISSHDSDAIVSIIIAMSLMSLMSLTSLAMESDSASVAAG